MQILFPVRGRKLPSTKSRVYNTVFANTIPRQGTETSLEAGTNFQCSCLQILFPVRGRKPNVYFLSKKLFVCKYYSPSGDGNLQSPLFQSPLLFANTIPRQGTKPLYYILFLFKETKNEFCIFYFLSSYKRAILKD